MAAGLFNRYIADGFKDDCITLLSKFAETQSARFADFVDVWQEMKFSLIYCGLNTFAELLEFTEEAMNISKQLFLPPNSDIARIGALYLVYGVYTQQPTRGLVKIRMTPDDWIHTMDFIENVREYGYADASYIFNFLCYNAAFMYTACNKEYGLERSYRRHQITTNHMREMMQCKNLTANQLLKPVFEDVDMAELENTRVNYENCKKILGLKEENQGMEFTSVTPLEDVVSTLKRVVDSFLPEQADASTSGSTESNPGAPNLSRSTDIGKDRQDLKQRAFQLKTLGQNHLKSCLSSAEDPETSIETPASTSESSGGPPPSSDPNGDKPSRVVKNIFRREKKSKKVKRISSTAKNSFPPESTESEHVDIVPDPIETDDVKPLKKNSQQPVRRSKRTALQPERYDD